MVRAPMEEVVEVTVEELLYRSEDGRFTVARVARTRRDDAFVAVGDIGSAVVGETLRLRGKLTEHATYGERFKVAGCTPVMPSTLGGIERFLSSNLVPNVGKRLAEELVNTFGLATLDVITTESERLRKVKGIGKRRAASLSKAVRARRAEAETVSFLLGLGLGQATAKKIMDRYEERAVSQVREDPYLVAEEVAGIGFKTADQIGRGVGIDDNDPRRAAGAALHVLARAVDDGNVFLPRDLLVQRTTDLSVPRERAAEAIETLAKRRLVAIETLGESTEDAVYPPPLLAAEEDVAKRLMVLAARKLKPRVTSSKTTDESLSEEQLAAVQASLRHGAMVLTGGPGTGKTTTVRAIVEAHEAVDHRVVLCAPTGRAAKRLSDATGREAKTIHRALEWSPGTGSFKRDDTAPLDAELILVDEASMIDLRLAAHLFRAVAPTSQLVLVGDVDQLPPVGPGAVLRDVIDSGVVPVERLSRVFRQAEESAIVRGAHDVLDGRSPRVTPSGTRGSGDLFFVSTRDGASLADRVVAVLKRMAKAYDLHPVHDVQVLSPMRRGPTGTEHLNQTLQAAFNPTRESGPLKGRPLLRENDKVMQLKNDYEREVYNGDLGVVAKVAGAQTFVRFDGREVQYGRDDLDALTLAYASTVHKVQGSEFPAVVIALHGSHYMMLTRPLLYTALTRAKQLVVLVGDKSAIARAARNAQQNDTYSWLARRLKDAAATS